MDFLYPLAGNYPITDDYREHKARPGNMRGGIDWACPNDTPVLAAQAGNVTFCGPDLSPGGGYGMHVRIQHAEGYLTIYGHLRQALVCVGDKVVAGQVIGRSDNTGNSSGPHLHFELRLNNNDIDPQPYLVDSLEPEEPERPVQAGERAAVDTPGSRLYLRREPGGKAVTLMPDGTPLLLTGAQDGDWVEVDQLVRGWCHKDYIKRQA
jgi:murein DD-endopeptidase MepM/ murein hydrolase activator NlpD